MTNKRKIQILKKIIKRFEKVVKQFNKDKQAYRSLEGSWGICNYGFWKVMTASERTEANKWLERNKYYFSTTIFFQKYMYVRMPSKESGFKWSLTKKGYQARINACKKAIERLSRELPTAN